MSYILASKINEQRQAKAVAAANKANMTLADAQAAYAKYIKLFVETNDPKYGRLAGWANTVARGIRINNGEKLFL